MKTHLATERDNGRHIFWDKECCECEAGSGDLQSQQARDTGESRRLSGHDMDGRDVSLSVVHIVGITVPVLCNQTHAQGKPHDRPGSTLAMDKIMNQSRKTHIIV